MSKEGLQASCVLYPIQTCVCVSVTYYNTALLSSGWAFFKNELKAKTQKRGLTLAKEKLTNDKN